MAATPTRTADPASAGGTANVVTYSTVSTGTAAADRITAVLISWETNANLLSVTCDSGAGDNPMKLDVNVRFSTTEGAAGAWIHNPTGTTATFKLTFDANPAINTNKISVYNIAGGAHAISQAVSATSTDMDATAPLTVSVTIPTGGCGIAVAACATAGTALKAWTSFTEEQELNVTNYTHTTATKTTSGTANCVVQGSNNAEDGALAVLVFMQTQTLPSAGLRTENTTRPTPGPFYPATLRTWTEQPPSTPVSVDAPCNKFDWPLPIRSIETVRTWTQAPQPAAAAVVSYIPGRVVEWGVSDQPDKQIRTWTNAPQPVAAVRIINQSDWPLPIRRVEPIRTWTQAPQQAAPVVGNPLNQFHWPPPIRRAEPIRTWTQTPMFAAPVVAASYIPGRVTEWGVADRIPFTPSLDVRNTALLGSQPVVTPPRNQYLWPLPTRRVEPTRTWTRGPQQAAPVVGKPVNQYDWPVPIARQYPAQLRTWINNGITVSYLARDIYVAPRFPRPRFDYWLAPVNVGPLTAPAPAKPINQSDWPLPIRRVEQARTWLQTPLFAAQVTLIPGRVIEWGVTDRVSFQYEQPIRNGALLATPAGPKPVNQSDWPLPQRRLYPLQPARDNNPTITATPERMPRNQYSWPLPIRVPERARSWTQSPTFAAAIVTLPRNQSDWPLPKRAEQPIRTWTESPQTTEAGPHNQFDWPLPIRAAQPIRTWIEVPQQPETRPCNQYDWRVPERAAQPVRTWIQLPQQAAAPATPRNQYDWRLPDRAAQPVRTWLQTALALQATPPPTPPPNRQQHWPRFLPPPFQYDTLPVNVALFTGPPPTLPRSPTKMGPRDRVEDRRINAAQGGRSNAAQTGRSNSPGDSRLTRDTN